MQNYLRLSQRKSGCGLFLRFSFLISSSAKGCIKVVPHIQRDVISAFNDAMTREHKGEANL